MSPILLASIVIRVVGVVYSVVLLYRSRDRRFGFLTVMLGLMASRQIWTAQTADAAGLDELPGLVVSVLALLTVYYLSEYVGEERRIKSELESTNDRLRSFRKAVEHAGHAIFLTDTEGTIEYANPATEDVTGYAPDEVVGETPSLWKSGEHEDNFYEEMWETISAGEVWDGEIVNRRKNGELCWVDMTIAPITEDGEVERYVAVDTDVTDRKERELRIRDQNARLELLNTTNEVIRDVNRELVQADSKEELERAVCERFAEASPYESAWFATRNAVNDTVRSRLNNGIDEATLQEMVSAINDAERDTVVDLALETDATKISRGDDEGGGGYATVDTAVTVAIPLSYRDAHYGALVLHANREETPEALDTGVLDELGETIGYAINAAESQRSLVTDQVTELTFELGSGDDPLVELASVLGGDLDLERVTTGADDTIVGFVELSDVADETVAEYVEESEGVIGAQLVCESDGCLYRITVSETNSIVSTLAQYGGAVRSLSVRDGEGRLRAEFSETADVRSVVEAVRGNHRGAELVGRRKRDRTPDTHGQFRGRIEDSLTDRQLEAIQLAHFGGFFDWPRATSGEQLAGKMGVCQSTYLQHLRAGQGKVFDALFESVSPAGRNARASADS
ncbi:MAG: bacterio-opsin activator domain-containing protein [Haloferacaceae archaeon]